MDSYFKPKNERPVDIAPITGKEYTDDNHPLTVDLPKLKQDILLAIYRLREALLCGNSKRVVV